LIDISSSITTNAMTARRHQSGQPFDDPWMLDAQGNATRDPGVLFADPPGTILPLGGLAAGHKGFGLAVLIEALTGGLAGFGRAARREGGGRACSRGLYAPAGFGGTPPSPRKRDGPGAPCRNTPPRHASEPVRMPGDRAMARRADQLAHGVHLHPTIRTPL